MSVINQMLKDLDRRRQERGGRLVQVQELLERLEEDLPVNRRQAILLVVMLSVVAGAGIWSWKKFSSKPLAALTGIQSIWRGSETERSPAGMPPVAPLTTPAPVTAGPVPPPAQPVAAAPPPTPTHVAPVHEPAPAAAPNAAVEGIVKAESLTPVTKLPESAMVTPLPGVASAPPAFRAAEIPAIAAVPAHPVVAPPLPAAGHEASVPPATASPARREAARPPSTPSVKPAKTTAERKAKPASEPNVATAKPIAPPPLAPVESEMPAAPMRIRPSEPAPAVAASVYQQAGQQMAAGDFGGAMETLRQALDRAPADARLRLALADIHINLGQKDKARSVLREGLRHKPGDGDLSKLYAGLLAEDGDGDQAIAVLEDAMAVPGGGNKAELLALAAALNQQAGRYIQAERSYRLLLQQQSDNGPWLMGLAITLQKQGKNAEALEAYRQALYSGGLAPPVQRYISEQIRGLER